MPVQKMCYLGCEIVLRHLRKIQNETLSANHTFTEQKLRPLILPPFLREQKSNMADKELVSNH